MPNVSKRVVWLWIAAAVCATALISLVACSPSAPTQPTADAAPTVASTETKAPAVAPTEAVPVETEAQPTETVAATAAGPATADPPTVDVVALFEERCSMCHSLDRSTSAQKTLDEWEQTVTRMVGKGAQLDSAEQTMVIEYLAATYSP